MLRRRNSIRKITLLCVLVFGVPHAHAAVFVDPLGDTFGVGPVQHDITSIAAQITVTDLVIDVSFADPISPASAFSADSVAGFIDIDIDQDIGTGVVSRPTLFGTGPSGLGVEFFVDLLSEQFTPGSADLIDTSSFLSVGSVAVLFDTSSFSLSVPLALLADDGFVNFGVVMGTFFEATDEATNPGLPPANTVPEPGSLAIWILLGLTVVSYGRWSARSSRRGSDVTKSSSS